MKKRSDLKLTIKARIEWFENETNIQSLFGLFCINDIDFMVQYVDTKG
jgi:hypothetical protein